MLSIGNVTLVRPLILAPMAGISDLPFRLVNRSAGCGLAFTEMISACSLGYKSSRTSHMLSIAPEDRPLGIQLLGKDPDIIRRALDIVSEHSFDITDFNAACPARKIVSKGKGAALLREPERLQKLLKLIVDNTDVPVTVKIRSGWDGASINAAEIALRAQDAGVSGIFIHGRTKMQGYSGKVDYDVIRKIKESVDIPVIASGDALTPDLIRKHFDETGCDGVAIARGSLGNPWIFHETAQYLECGEIPSRPDVHEITRVMKRHLDLNIEHVGERVGIIRFRKFFAWYTRGMAARKLKTRAFLAATRDQMMQLIDEVKTLPAAGDDLSFRKLAVKYFQVTGQGNI